MLTGKMRRSDRQITDRREIDEILTNGWLGHLAMALDGQPYAVPMNYLYLGDTVVFHSAMEGQKVRILSANPKACFEIAECGAWVPANKPAYQGLTFRSVIVFGSIRTVDQVDRKIDLLNRILTKYTGQVDRWQLSPADVDNVMVLELEIEQLTGKRRRAFAVGDRVRLRPPELMAADASELPGNLKPETLYTVAAVDERDWVRLASSEIDNSDRELSLQAEEACWYPWQLFERIIR